MPNQPSPDKEVLSFQVPRALKSRICKLAKRRGEPMSQTIVAILTHATKDITLSAEDYRAIAEAVERARHHLPSRAARTKGGHRKGGR